MNQKEAVIGVSAEENAIIVIRLSDKRSLNEAANEFFSQTGVTAQRLTSGRIHGFRSTSGDFTAQSDQGVLQGFAAFVDYNGHIYQLLGYTSQELWHNYQQGLVASINSFDRLTDRKILSVKPQYIKLVKINRNMSLGEFNRRYPSGVSLEVLARINQVDTNAQLRAGQQVKRVVGETFE
jgi:predicted Zn-dependent protease